MTYTVTHYARPWTANSQRTMHYQQRSRLVKEWRQAFWALAVEAKLPRLTRVSVVAELKLKGRRSQDVGACWPAVKAAVDGLVDAGVLPDDTPDHLTALTFVAPVFGCERDELTLRVEEAA